jgi:hypothetical protein
VLHNIPIGEGFYKVKFIKCIVFAIPLFDPSEDEKIIKNVDGGGGGGGVFTKWYIDEIV